MSADSEIITGHPFSAIKFSRTVHIGADGTATVLAERPALHIARNEDGRIAIVHDLQPLPCDPSEPWKLQHTETRPRCDFWGLMIFDPNLGKVWHWGDGRSSDHGLVQVDLLPSQLTGAKMATSVIPGGKIDESRPNVSVQDLHEQNIEGVRARGVRTITLHTDSGGIEKLTIHEVWTSTEMALVLRVVDGDPAGEEVVSGLSDISFVPSPQLFQPPPDRKPHHYTEGQYVDFDLPRLADWLVR